MGSDGVPRAIAPDVALAIVDGQRVRGHGLRQKPEERVLQVGAEVPQHRGLRALVHAMILLERVEQLAKLRGAPRRPLRQPAAQVEDQRGVVNGPGHGRAQPPELSGARNRIAGRPVVGSIWLPIRSNDLIRETSS